MINSLDYKVEWVQAQSADLIIIGSFYKPATKSLRWCPKPLRPKIQGGLDLLDALRGNRKSPPLTLFHTGENLRHNHFDANYSISSDLAVTNPNHYRSPYWMEMIDWSHEGVQGNENRRYGELLQSSRLLKPLSEQFLSRDNSAIFLSSHLREPRESLLRALQTCIPVITGGSQFDITVKNHNSSGFYKNKILPQHRFNLCPENSLYPGYYTEKIPEAFHSGCLPITWADPNINVDFNPKAFINMLDMASDNYQTLQEIIVSERILSKFAEQPLLLTQPSISGLRSFVKDILTQAQS